MSGSPPENQLGADEWRAIIEAKGLDFEVVSDSMYPTLRRGDKVAVSPIPENGPRPGRIVVYWRGKLFAHRYLGGGVCRGDNHLHVDPPVERAQMVGVATEIVRGGRKRPAGEEIPLTTFLHRLWLPVRRAAAIIKRRILG